MSQYPRKLVALILASHTYAISALLCYTDVTPVCGTSYKLTNQEPVKCGPTAKWCMTVVYRVGVLCFADRRCGNSTNPNPAVGGDEDCARIANDNRSLEVCNFCGNDFCNDGRRLQYPDGLFVNGSQEAKKHLIPIYIDDILERKGMSSAFHQVVTSCFVNMLSVLIRLIL